MTPMLKAKMRVKDNVDDGADEDGDHAEGSKALSGNEGVEP